ncbi:MAG: tetratricopeptide repeat protein [Candidatus Riflebacteria bacterium]|nr:tetratricopeptide repeat protein [Candidatus Riflebacteria bacterium]
MKTNIYLSGSFTKKVKTSFLAKISVLLLFFLIVACNQVSSKELPLGLRKASILYQNQEYAEAANAAIDYLRYHNEDLDALTIAGIASFHTSKYEDSYKYLSEAVRKDPNNPVLREYIKLLSEHFYLAQSGQAKFSLKDFISEEDETYRYLAYDSLSDEEKNFLLRKELFAPILPDLPPQQTTQDISEAILPHFSEKLLKESDNTEKDKIQKTSQGTPDLTQSEKHLSDEGAVFSLALRAYETGKYEQANLLFSQLNKASPKNDAYFLYLARSEFHMKHYKRLVLLLMPIINDDSKLEKFSLEERDELKHMMKAATQEF